jgi:hypothetical protein
MYSIGCAHTGRLEHKLPFVSHNEAVTHTSPWRREKERERGTSVEIGRDRQVVSLLNDVWSFDVCFSFDDG